MDLNQVLFAGLRQQSMFKKNTAAPDEGFIRHIVLNILRSYNKQFYSKYGELVLCCDSKRYWRRDVFPYYKSNRKKDRDASDVDWTEIFRIMGNLKAELKENYVHKVVDVEGAEADDVIAVLAKAFHGNEKILIVSQDKDFMQLQAYDNVDQYNPLTKKYITCKEPDRMLKEHILKGDRGDGIPNFLSDDNVLDSDTRQKVLTTKKLVEYMNTDPGKLPATLARGYARNATLIDFSHIPQSLQDAILAAYEASPKHSRQQFMNYMISKQLVKLLSDLEDF